LRKDFIIDAYQVFEAKCLGASAYLLIVACLKPKDLTSLIALGSELGMTPLVEAHTESEVQTALDAGARLIGINNRDLKTFTIDLQTSYKLRKLIPSEIPMVAESGILSSTDLKNLAEAGIQAALIGETLMRQKDITAKLKELFSF
jgi:indole-3-glycerol phosphate synthase